MNKYLTWSGFRCFSVCFVPSSFGFFRCIRISEWTHLQFPLGFCGSDQLPSAVFKLILQIFCWLASFLFDRFDFLHSASFLICFCFFWILLLFSCCVWLPDFARFHFCSYFFDLLGFVLSTQFLQIFRCHILSSILLLVSGIALSIPKRLPKCNAAVSRMPSLWKPVHLRICVPCVILCRHVFSCFCLPLFFTRKRNSLTHYLHSSHLDLSLRRFSLRVGSFFFVPLL